MNGNEMWRGSILKAYFVLWHSNGFYPFKWLLLDTFLLGGEESSALDTEQTKTSPWHNIKLILLNFAYQLSSQICWKREQKLEASKPTKARMFKNKRKRTTGNFEASEKKEITKLYNEQNDIWWVCFNLWDRNKTYETAYKTTLQSMHFEKKSRSFFFLEFYLDRKPLSSVFQCFFSR